MWPMVDAPTRGHDVKQLLTKAGVGTTFDNFGQTVPNEGQSL